VAIELAEESIFLISPDVKPNGQTSQKLKQTEFRPLFEKLSDISNFFHKMAAKTVPDDVQWR
jgi:hypothetical protein